MSVPGSIKTRLLLLMITMAVVIAASVSAVHLNGLIGTWLDGVKERVEITGKQVKTALTERVNQLPLEPAATVDQTKQQWYTAIESDVGFQQFLVETMLQSKSILEISISDDHARILMSSIPERVGKQMPVSPPFEILMRMGPLERIWAALSKRMIFSYRIPLGIDSHPKPLFQIDVLVSSVLLQSTVTPHMMGIASASAFAVLVAVALSLWAANISLSPLKAVGRQLDEISKGTPAPAPDPGSTTREFAVVQSKLNLLGEQFRGAQQLIEKLEEAILLFDRDENLILAGEPAQRLLGFSRTELRGKTLRDLFPPSSELGGALRNALHMQLPFENRNFTWHRPGQGPMRLAVNIELLPGADQGGRSGALVSLRDVEGRKQVQSQLDLSERLTAIGRLTGDVAHEIKNPLNAIILRLEVLRAKVSEPVPEANPEIDIIASEVTRLDRVVKTFLDFTRPVDLTMSDVDLVEVVTEIVTFVKPEAAQSNVLISQVCEPGPFVLRADRDLLKQAMLNVVMNGIEAMQPKGGGTMRIKIERSFTSSAGGQCVVSFSDSGPGIPEDSRNKIFQLYFSTKKKGSGIGLAMAYRVAQLHGGKIDFVSEPGKGTTFLFLLPLAPGGAA